MIKTVGKLKNGLNGVITTPADKSISHRAVILSSLAKGKSVIKNFSNGQDPLSTLKVCKNLGLEYELGDNLIINSIGKYTEPKNSLDCGNSGTTMRFMSGVLAGQNFDSVLIGDESLSKRPMKRIIEPLALMGANIQSNDGKAPLNIYGQNLHSIDYTSKLSSAQVKSCVLLAGLNCDGKTIYKEPYVSRDHTERMLKYMGANIQTKGNVTEIEKSQLEPSVIEICGDISSASFFIVAGLIVPNSKIVLKNVGFNPTRTGIIDIVNKMGGSIEILDKREVSNEPVGDLRITYSNLKACNIEGEIIPKLIDELPVIAVLATQAEGTTVIKDAQDLRNKESDRICAIVSELKKLGANIEETPDGFIVYGKTVLKGGTDVKTYHDHRLAMSLYIAGLICEKPINIEGFEWVNISFPNFEELFDLLN